MKFPVVVTTPSIYQVDLLDTTPSAQSKMVVGIVDVGVGSINGQRVHGVEEVLLVEGGAYAVHAL